MPHVGPGPQQPGNGGAVGEVDQPIDSVVAADLSFILPRPDLHGPTHRGAGREPRRQRGSPFGYFQHLLKIGYPPKIAKPAAAACLDAPPGRRVQ